MPMLTDVERPPARRPAALEDGGGGPQGKRARRGPPLAITDGSPSGPPPPPPGAGALAVPSSSRSSQQPAQFYIGDPQSAKKRRIVEALTKNAAALAKKLKEAKEAREAAARSRSIPGVRPPAALKTKGKAGLNRLRMAQDLLALEGSGG